MFTEDDDYFGDEVLPPCDSLTEDDISFGVECDNTTVTEPEIRHRDPLFERLLSQIWSDYQAKLNTESSLYGFVVDPLDVDAHLKEPIALQQTGSVYDADVKMSGIKVYGLSGINLTESLVTRSENLTDIDIKVEFSFNELVVNGSYSLKVSLNAKR